MSVLSPLFMSTEYEVIEQPPLSEGAVHPIVILEIDESIKKGRSGYDGTRQALKMT